MDLDSYYTVGFFVGLATLLSGAYDAGAAVVASWPGSTLKAEWVPWEYMGWALKKAHSCKWLPVNSKEWRAIAEGRSELNCVRLYSPIAKKQQQIA